MPPPITLWVRQSIGQDVGNVKNTFSSWDNCMSEAYCKWPVIIGIVVASLTVASIVFCLARCLCCGAECCCACFSCCNACCPSPRGKRSKYDNNPPPPPQPYPYQGYMPTPAPMYNPQPQFAQFDASRQKPVNEDALPAMPSWENAPSKKVLQEHNDDMELGTLDPVHEQTAPMLANQAPTPRVGHSEVPGSEGLPYQQYGAYHGGDLGSPYSQQNQLHEAPPSPYGGPQSPAQQFGAAAYGRQQSGHQRPNPYAQQQRPQPAYSSYAASETSTRYEPSTTYGGQESGTVYHSRQAAPPAGWQQNSGPGAAPAAMGRKPVQNTWREV